MVVTRPEPEPHPASTPPRAARPGAPSARAVVVAPSWRRLVAAAIDGVGLMTVWLLGALAIASASAEPVPGGPWNLLDQLVDYVNARPTAVLLAGLLFAALLFALPLLFERFGRGTPGKRVLGLTLIDARGERPSAGRLAAHAALRVVGTLLFMVGPLSGLVDPERRTLYDRLAGVYVIVT